MGKVSYFMHSIMDTWNLEGEQHFNRDFAINSKFISCYISALNKNVVIGSNEKSNQPLWRADGIEVMRRLRHIREFSTRTRQRWTNAKIKKPLTLYRDNISFFFFHRPTLIHLGILPIIFRDLTHFLDDRLETLHCQVLVISEGKLWKTPASSGFLHSPRI